MNLRFFSLLFLTVLGTAVAQQADEQQAVTEARRFRAELVADIAAGRMPPAGALAKLKEKRAFFGPNSDADTDQAQAATDIGQRLLNSAASEKADAFFRAAEISLGQAINRAADSATKARLLVNRAQIRSLHLNKKAEAAADVKQAALLQPEDQYVRSWQELLRRRDAATLQAQSESKR